MPLEVIEQILSDYQHTHTSMSIIFDGIPRTIEQLEMFDKIVSDYIVLYLDLDEAEALKRLTARRIDPTNGQSFPHDFTGDVSPHTGARLVKRADDDENSIKKRIASFYEQTIVLLEEWKKRGKRIYHINANAPIEEVTQTITTILSTY